MKLRLNEDGDTLQHGRLVNDEKDRLCVFDLVMLLPVMQWIAYAYTYRVEIQSDPFAGNGEIVSFDVNENGEVLICVEDLADHQIHTMIFDVQGNVLCSLLIYKYDDPFLDCAFQDVQNIALYSNRGSRIYVIDRLGNALYDYSNEGINIVLIKLKKEAFFGDIQFKRNRTHSQIIKIQDGVEEIFYEVGVGNRNETMQFVLFMIMHAVLTVFIAGVIVKEIRKKRQEGPRGSFWSNIFDMMDRL